MTTDITELAQSLKAAAENAIGAHERLSAYPYGEIIDISQHEGEQIDIDITDINEFHEEASPANILALVEALEKAQQRIDELENDEVCQRLANAEHQLYMAELAKHNLKASRKAQFRKRKASEKRIAELEAQNEYIRKRYQQLDLLIGKNILVMQAAIIEWQTTGDAKNGLAWIYNTLFGPGELPDEAEKDAQAYFDRKYAPLDEELMALHKWFWEQSEAERAAAGIKVEAE
ncbi:TPA: ead/Ea22-like family protein [Raoultella ornithinolytica]|nr:ead/Ea22-like family protein [Raoultella ornithinolytica]